MGKEASLSTLVQVGVDILNVSRDANTNTAVAQIGDVVAQQPDADRAEWYQHVGFISIPSNPVPGQTAAQGVVCKRGADDAVIASRDLRGQALAANLRAGEACVYAGGSDGNAQARVVLKANGTIAILTTDSNTSSGNSIYYRVTPKEERFHAPFGKRWFDATGYHIRTPAGAKLDMGGIGLPAPFSSYGNYVALTAELVRIDAAVLSLGRDTGNMQPVVLGTTLVSILNIIYTALNSIADAGNPVPKAQATAMLPLIATVLGKTSVA